MKKSPIQKLTPSTSFVVLIGTVYASLVKPDRQGCSKLSMCVTQLGVPHTIAVMKANKVNDRCFLVLVNEAVLTIRVPCTCTALRGTANNTNTYHCGHEYLQIKASIAILKIV